MAGHSKWANIQHRKGAQDKRRAKIFTKWIREITTAARMSGGDPNANPRLRLAMDKAFAANMPRDTIERAIKRGVGGEDGSHYDEIRYEGYAPGGVAVVVDTMTDNRTRTVAEVRHAFSKNGGNLGTDGSVAYLFSKQGFFIFAPDQDAEQILDIALEAGAQDVINHEDGSTEVLSAPEDFESIKTIFIQKKLEIADCEVTLRAANDVLVTGDIAKSVQKMLDMLEDLDDVQAVYSNAVFE